VHADHQGVLLTQLAAQAVGEAPLGGLGRAVATGTRRAQPAQHREHIDQRTAALLGQDGRKGTADAQGAEGVDVKVLLQILDAVLCQQRAVFQKACVIDHDAHVRAVLGGALHAGLVGDVEGNRGAAGNIHAVRVPRTGIDLCRPPFQQRGDEGFAQAPIGAGDQYHFSTNIHDQLQAAN